MHSSCAQPVYNGLASCGQYSELIPQQYGTQISLWISTYSIPSLYTLCMQLYAATVDRITSVIDRFYTVSTVLTKTTTT